MGCGKDRKPMAADPGRKESAMHRAHIVRVVTSLVLLGTALAVAPQPSAGAQTTQATLTLTATGDAQVNSANPNNAYGSVTKMAVCTTCALAGQPTKRAYVQFNTSGITGNVTSARLPCLLNGRNADPGRPWRRPALE